MSDIAQSESTLSDADQVIAHLREQLGRKTAQIAALEVEIAVLREKQWLFEGCPDD